MLGSPLAGSVNAYGLLKSADPYGLDASNIVAEGGYSIKAAGVNASIDTIYSNVAEWLYKNHTGSELGTRGGVIVKPTPHFDRFDVLSGAYKYSQTVKQRRSVFANAAIGGLYLYPDYTRSKFVSSSPAAWYGGSALQSYGPNNHLFGLSPVTACNTNFSRRNTVSNNQTNVFLLLSNSSDKTIMTVPETRDTDQDGNRLHSAWPKTGVARGVGDGTVPMGGQRRKLADWMGIDVATVESNCSLVGAYGKHAEMTGNSSLQSWIVTKLGVAGPPVSSASDAIKAASANAPEYLLSFSQPTARVYWDVANVGRLGTDSADGAADTLEVAGAAATVNNTNENVALQMQKDTAGTVSATFRLRDTGVNILASHFSVATSSAQSNSTNSAKFIARPGVPVSFTGNLDPVLPSVSFDMVGPKSPGDLRALPSVNTTAITWIAPATASDLLAAGSGRRLKAGRGCRVYIAVNGFALRRRVKHCGRERNSRGGCGCSRPL